MPTGRRRERADPAGAVHRGRLDADEIDLGTERCAAEIGSGGARIVF
jgi:hypothetical protein